MTVDVQQNNNDDIVCVCVCVCVSDKATSEARENSSNDSLPPRLSLLCELLVFVKNMEFVSSSFLQAQHLSSIAGSK